MCNSHQQMETLRNRTRLEVTACGSRQEATVHCNRPDLSSRSLSFTGSASTGHTASVLSFHNVTLFPLNRHEVIMRNLQMCRFLRASSPFTAMEGTHQVCPSRHLREHAAEDVYEVVQSPQVAVLSVALHPCSPVVQSLRLWQGDRLPKVNHPHSGLPGGVVHKQQGAAHHLQPTHGQVRV